MERASHMANPNVCVMSLERVMSFIRRIAQLGPDSKYRCVSLAWRSAIEM